MIHSKDHFIKQVSFIPSLSCSVTFIIFMVVSMVSWGNYDLGVAEYKKRNFSRAFIEFKKASREDDVRAQTALALMYKYGEGTKTDLTLAYQWNLKAAKLGHPPAQYNVGVMLLDGAGVERDEEKGRDFISLAAEQGFARAIEKIQFEKAEILENENPNWSRNWDLRVPTHLNSPHSDNTFKIQLGAMSSKEKAEILWNDILIKNRVLFSDLNLSFQRVKLVDKIIWRVQAGDFETKEEATETCKLLFEKDKNNSGCLVVYN